MIIISSAIFIVLLLCDLPSLIRKKEKRELAVYLVLSCITLIYITRFVLGKELFSAIEAMSNFVENTLGLSYEFWQGHS